MLSSPGQAQHCGLGTTPRDIRPALQPAAFEADSLTVAYGALPMQRDGRLQHATAAPLPAGCRLRVWNLRFARLP
jgi:hypothetical protein